MRRRCSARASARVRRFADIVKMVHPKPAGATREAFYGYMLGRPHEADALPKLVMQFEQFKAAKRRRCRTCRSRCCRRCRFRGQGLGERSRRTASWQTTRMNLNTFARHGVFEDAGMARSIAARLRDAEEIAPGAGVSVPVADGVSELRCGRSAGGAGRVAGRDGAGDRERAGDRGRRWWCARTFRVRCRARSRVTAQGSTTAVQCIDVAALVAASVLRKNPSADVLPFEQDVVSVDLNSRDSVMTNARTLASIGGGGTNCSAPVRFLNQREGEGGPGDLRLG